MKQEKKNLKDILKTFFLWFGIIFFSALFLFTMASYYYPTYTYNLYLVNNTCDNAREICFHNATEHLCRNSKTTLRESLYEINKFTCECTIVNCVK